MTEEYSEIDSKKRKFELHEPIDFIARSQDYINYGNVISLNEENVETKSKGEVNCVFLNHDDQVSDRGVFTVFTHTAAKTNLQPVLSDLSLCEDNYFTNNISKDQLLQNAALSVDPMSQKWSKEEHESFLRGMRMHGKNWDQVATQVPSRTTVQIAEYANQFFLKKSRMAVMGGGNVSKRQKLTADHSDAHLNTTLDSLPVTNDQECGTTQTINTIVTADLQNIRVEETATRSVSNVPRKEMNIKAEARLVAKPLTKIKSADAVLRCPYTLASVVRMIHSPLFATLLEAFPELGDFLVCAAPDQQVIVERLPDTRAISRRIPPIPFKAPHVASPHVASVSSVPVPPVSSSVPPSVSTSGQYFYSGVFPIPETATMVPIPAPVSPLSVPEVVMNSKVISSDACDDKKRNFPAVNKIVPEERQAAEILAAQMLSNLAAPFHQECSSSSSSSRHTPPLEERMAVYQTFGTDNSNPQEQQQDLPTSVGQRPSVEVQLADNHINGDEKNRDDDEKEEEEEDGEEEEGNIETADHSVHPDRAEDSSQNKAPNRNSKKYRHLKLYDKYEIVQKLRYYEMEARNAKSVCNMHSAVAREYDVCESTIYQIVKKQLAIEAKYLAQQIEAESGVKRKSRPRKKKQSPVVEASSFSFSGTGEDYSVKQQQQQQQMPQNASLPAVPVPHYVGNPVADQCVAAAADCFPALPNALQLQAAITAAFGSGFMVTQAAPALSARDF